MAKPITCKYCSHRYFPVEREKWTANNMPCPGCQITYSTLPPTERSLRILQNQFFESNRDGKYLDEMFTILVPYAQSLILKLYPNAVPSVEQLEHHSLQVATFLIEDYCRNPNFKIRVSFGAFIPAKIRQSLFGNQEKDIEAMAKKYGFSTIAIDKENPDGVDHVAFQLADKASTSGNMDYLQLIQETSEIKEYLCGLIFSFGDLSTDEETEYRRLMFIVVYLEQGEAAFDKFQNKFGRFGKLEAMQTLKLVHRELAQMR